MSSFPDLYTYSDYGSNHGDFLSRHANFEDFGNALVCQPAFDNGFSNPWSLMHLARARAHLCAPPGALGSSCSSDASPVNPTTK